MTTPATAVPPREIQIAAPPKTMLGAALVVEVVYRNAGPDPVQFREPAKTWEVMLAANHGDAPPELRPLGRILHRESGGVSRQVLEPAQVVRLDPGGEHRFSFDVWERWPELIEPGKLRLRIVDQTKDSATAVSNRVEVRVLFAESSVPALLDLVRSDSSSPEAREFAARLLRQLRPDFEVVPEASTDADHAANRSAAAAFESWWSAHKADRTTKEIIARINGSAAVAPPP
jgi:hypothetical protein